MNIPLSHLKNDSLPFQKNNILITYCSHGLRSVQAVKALKSRGYKNVYNGGALLDLEKIIIKKE